MFTFALSTGEISAKCYVRLRMVMNFDEGMQSTILQQVQMSIIAMQELRMGLGAGWKDPGQIWLMM